jgi:hypothetical protein
VDRTTGRLADRTTGRLADRATHRATRLNDLINLKFSIPFTLPTETSNLAGIYIS